MEPFVKLTDHAKHRSLSRYGIPAEKLLELAQKAVMFGFGTGDAPTPEVKEFLLRKSKGNRKAYSFYGYVFVFSPDLVLITTFRMPDKYLYLI